MAHRQNIPPFPPPVEATATGNTISLRLPEGPTAKFELRFVPSLTRRTADLLTDESDPGRPILVIYERASNDAREALRAASVAYAGADGRLFLRAPGILVEREEPKRSAAGTELVNFSGPTAVRNPFSKRSSRVPRWLLLHPRETFFLSELAKAVDLTPSATSRIVRALEDAAFVHESEGEGSGRRKNVRLERPRELLDAWLLRWERRSTPERRWDIGAHDPEDAIHRVEAAGRRAKAAVAIGGVAGAALVNRKVEPADVLVWTTSEGATDLAEVLQPVPSRAGRGTVRISVAPDPWTLGLAERLDGVPVADPVQLWLDCASGGERELEAADAVAQVVGWT